MTEIHMKALVIKREENVFMANLTGQAERYHEMVEYIKNIVQLQVELTIVERNLLSVAYMNLVGTRRESWYSISSTIQKEECMGNSIHLLRIKEYRIKVEKELNEICDDILKLLEDYLITGATTAESEVHYLKMKGDYHRYSAEIATGEERKDQTRDSLDAYTRASVIALSDLAPTHPVRLGLALNFSVFYYDIMNSTEQACQLARQAFDDALADLDASDSYRDSALIMQIIRDNVLLWTSDLQGQDKQDDSNPMKTEVYSRGNQCACECRSLYPLD